MWEHVNVATAAVAVGGLEGSDGGVVAERGGVLEVVGRWTFRRRWASLRAF